MNEYEYQIFIEQLLRRVNHMGLSPSKMALRKMLEDFKTEMYHREKTSLTSDGESTF